MTSTQRAELFLARCGEAFATLPPRGFVVSGDAARCLWTRARIPGGDAGVWKRFCHPFPQWIDLLGPPQLSLPEGTRVDDSRVARECGLAMVSSAQEVTIPELGLLRLVAPSFVLAEVLTDYTDPLRVTRVADLLRCMPPGEAVDLEEVRAILKAVGEGDRFETLLQVAYVV